MALASPEGQKKAAALHKFTQFMGNAFVTGKIDSQQWQEYLRSIAQMANNNAGEGWSREFDHERAEDYLTTINRTLNKLNRTSGGLDEAKTAPQRDLIQLFKNSPQRSLAEAGIDAIRGLVDENYNVEDYYDDGNLFEDLDFTGISVIIEGRLRLS